MSKSAEAARLVITLGEPAGIGADVLIQLAQEASTQKWLVCACPNTLQTRAREMGLTLQIHQCERPDEDFPTATGTIAVWPVHTAQKVQCGVLNKKNAPYVLECLQKSVALCLKDPRYGLVTGPVNKGHLLRSDIAFYGHTEYLAKLCKAPKPVMLLANQHMRVALATTHIPLARVAQAINPDMLMHCLSVLHDFLSSELGLDAPVIGVCGLNPHAGEAGMLGDEEKTIIEPCLDQLRARGMNLLGPLSADTAFVSKKVEVDAMLAMYHDQGLPVLKYAGFGETVNITLGLPIVRTSVDHGTALEIAGSGKADPASMRAAMSTATQLIEARMHVNHIH